LLDTTFFKYCIIFKSEKIKLEKEKQMRIDAEKKRDELAARLYEFEKQIKQSTDALVCLMFEFEFFFINFILIR
jgi:hypothetical protein